MSINIVPFPSMPFNLREIPLSTAGNISPNNNSVVISALSGTFYLPSIVDCVDGQFMAISNSAGSGSVTISRALTTTDTVDGSTTATLGFGKNMFLAAHKTVSPYNWIIIMIPGY